MGLWSRWAISLPVDSSTHFLQHSFPRLKSSLGHISHHSGDVFQSSKYPCCRCCLQFHMFDSRQKDRYHVMHPLTVFGLPGRTAPGECYIFIDRMRQVRLESPRLCASNGIGHSLMRWSLRRQTLASIAESPRRWPLCTVIDAIEIGLASSN